MTEDFIDNNILELKNNTFTIGNARYIVTAKQSEHAKETAFQIVKRLIKNSTSVFIDELKNNSLNGCDSGGEK